MNTVSGPQFNETFEAFRQDASQYTPMHKSGEADGSTATGAIVFWPKHVPPSMPLSLCTEWTTCHPSYGGDKSAGEKVWQRQLTWADSMSSIHRLAYMIKPYASPLCIEYSAIVAHAHATHWAARVFRENMGLAPVLPLIDVMGWAPPAKAPPGAAGLIIPTSFTPYMPVKTTKWLRFDDADPLPGMDMYGISGIMTLMMLTGTGMMHGDLHLHNVLTLPLPCTLGFITRYGKHEVRLPFTPCITDFDGAVYAFYGKPDESVFKDSIINCLLHLLCLQQYTWELDRSPFVNPLIRAVQAAFTYNGEKAEIMLHYVMEALFDSTRFTAIIGNWMMKNPYSSALNDFKLPFGRGDINLVFDMRTDASIFSMAQFSGSEAGQELNTYLLNILNTPPTIKTYYHLAESSVLMADATRFPCVNLRGPDLCVTIKMCRPLEIAHQNVLRPRYDMLLRVVADVNLLNIWIRRAVKTGCWVSPDLSEKWDACQFVEVVLPPPVAVVLPPPVAVVLPSGGGKPPKPNKFIGPGVRSHPFSRAKLSLLLY